MPFEVIRFCDSYAFRSRNLMSSLAVVNLIREHLQHADTSGSMYQVISSKAHDIARLSYLLVDSRMYSS